MSEAPTRIYVMVADPGDDSPWRYFKVGYSSRLLSRISAVQTGCPMPITAVMNVPLPDWREARNVENRLHGLLLGYRVSGEWFKFNMTDPEQKEDFGHACRTALTPVLGEGWKWEFANMRKLKEYIGSGELAREIKAMHTAHAYRLARGMKMW